MTTADPLVAAIAQLLARHHTGRNQPVQPAPWMTEAAAELVDCMRSIGWNPYRDDLAPDCLVPLSVLAPEINRRNQP